MTDQLATETFRIGAHHQLFHAELRAWRVARGLTQKQVSVMAGMHSQRISWLETFKAFPTPAELAKLEEITGIAGERLFPAWLKEWATGPKTATTEHDVTLAMLSEPSFMALPAPDDVEAESICEVDQGLLQGAVAGALADLTERERRVIALRYGLEDGKPRTLEDVARTEGRSTRERIRQIETKAFRKLRHPSRAQKLAPFVEHGPYSSAPVKQSEALITWLEQQCDREDLVGQLANVIVNTECCRSWALSGLKRHIEQKHAVPNSELFWTTFDQAGKEFLKSIR